MKIPERKKLVSRIQLNKIFGTEKEMEDFVNANHPKATIKQFWPVRGLICTIEIPCNEK